MHAGKILSITVVSGATSHCGKATDPFIHTGQASQKIFHTPLGRTARATHTEKLMHNMRKSSQMIYLVPDLQHSSFLSISKFAHTNYIIIFNPQEVKIEQQVKESQSSEGGETRSQNYGACPSCQQTTQKPKAQITHSIHNQTSTKLMASTASMSCPVLSKSSNISMLQQNTQQNQHG